MPIESGTEERVILKPPKAIPPSTPTQTGQAVTPPSTSTPVATGAFEPSPIVSKQPTVPATQPATFLMQQPTGQPDPTTLFWAGLNAPQYIGRYAPFTIPTGYKVASMVERDNRLQVTFKEAQPLVLQGLMHSLRAEPAYDLLQPRNVTLFTQGLKHSLEAEWIESQQNLLDLQAKEFAESDYGKFLEANPGAKRMYESAIAAGRTPPTFKSADYERLIAEYPGLARMVESAIHRGGSPTFWTTTTVEKKPTLQEAYQQYHDVRMPELLKGESETFYKNLGYPEYAGKYAPFNIPEGYKVQSLTQQGVNLAVTFAAIPTPTTQIPKSDVGLVLKSLPFLTSLGAGIVKPFVEGADVLKYNLANPLHALSPQLPSYPITLAEKQHLQERTDVAVFGLSTAAMIVAPPLIPLKLAGSIAIGLGARTLVASGIGAAVGAYYNPTLEGAGIGALLGGATYLGAFAVTRGVTYAVQKSVQGSYETSVQAGELWKPSTLQKLGMTVTGAKPKPLATSIVGLPTVQEGSLISAPYEETFIEGGQLATRTVIPSATQKWAGGLDVFELTNAPRTSGYGLTQPPPIAPQIPEGGLPLISLSNALRPIPQGKLSFTKEPQTYRVAEDSPLAFSKEYGALPTQTGLLQEIVKQEAKAYSLSGPMENVFGPAVTTVQKTATPFIVANLGEMTSWLLKQETQTKTVQASAITPLSISFQPQPRMKQIDETQYLTFPGQPLTVNVPTRETRETVVSPILDLGAGIISLGRQGAVTVQGLPSLEKQVYQITQPQKPLVSNILTTPLLEGAVTQKQEQITPLLTLNLLQNLMPGGTVTPRLDIPTLTTPGTTPKLIIPTIFDVPNIPPGTSTTTIPTPPFTPPPKLFTLPKSGLGGLGPREPASLLYPFGRQKRKYPVMTGGQVAKFLFSGKNETKRRKKK